MIDIPTLRSAACDEFRCEPVDFVSHRRSREAVDARHAAMWILRTSTGMSYAMIARLFGGLDHTSVMHAVSRVGHLMERNPDFTARVHRIIHRLEERTAA